LDNDGVDNPDGENGRLLPPPDSGNREFPALEGGLTNDWCGMRAISRTHGFAESSMRQWAVPGVGLGMAGSNAINAPPEKQPAAIINRRLTGNGSLAVEIQVKHSHAFTP